MRKRHGAAQVLVLTAGETYDFEAKGRWLDWCISHGPAGSASASFYMRFFERFRRVPEANWFALVGAIDEDMSSAFVIGAGCRKKINASGQLCCFRERRARVLLEQ
jgi:hypothetical protein